MASERERSHDGPWQGDGEGYDEYPVETPHVNSNDQLDVVRIAERDRPQFSQTLTSEVYGDLHAVRTLISGDHSLRSARNAAISPSGLRRSLNMGTRGDTNVSFQERFQS